MLINEEVGLNIMFSGIEEQENMTVMAGQQAGLSNVMTVKHRLSRTVDRLPAAYYV